MRRWCVCVNEIEREKGRCGFVEEREERNVRAVQWAQL